MLTLRNGCRSCDGREHGAPRDGRGL